MRRLDDPAQLEGKSDRDESVNANHFQDTFLFLRSPLNHTTRKFLASIAAKSSLDSAWAGFGCRACFVAFLICITFCRFYISLPKIIERSSFSVSLSRKHLNKHSVPVHRLVSAERNGFAPRADLKKRCWAVARQNQRHSSKCDETKQVYLE